MYVVFDRRATCRMHCRTLVVAEGGCVEDWVPELLFFIMTPGRAACRGCIPFALPRDSIVDFRKALCLPSAIIHRTNNPSSPSCL
jgi:hypothetical protein